ncbi:multidrug effflux MFS transporter [Pendulispora rubella]|uniref:Multidrug effflux MFS transporter n=2 Tax=Pendulispora rubella TaxID=2741070 RepID=A0ABZ2L7Y6_9BACT
MSALIAITALAVDMSLPAQPALVRDFGVAADRAQLTLSAFLFGYAVGQLLVGYLADACGRRVVLLVGMGLFACAGFACAVSTGLSVLTGLRFVQGVGAASGTVVAQAMVRDAYSEAESARVFATLIAVLALAPMVAPLIGAWLLVHVGWRAIFATLGVCGVVLVAMTALTLGETLAKRQPSSPGAMVAAFARFFRTTGTRLPASVVALSFASQFAFISASPFLLLEGYGIEPSHFGFYFGATAMALMFGSVSGERLLARGLSPQRVVRLGAAVLLAGGVLVAILVHVPRFGVFALLGPMLVCFLGIGLVGPSATALAMGPVPEIAGTAAATLGFLEMTAGSLSGYLVTKLGIDVRAFGLTIAGLAFACACVVLRMHFAEREAQA